MSNTSKIKNKKNRLDDWLIQHNFAENKQAAFILVTEGRVFVDGQKAVSPAQEFFANADIKIRMEGGYVGRGAFKIEAALNKFRIDVSDKICADIGAATGGFTEVLLRRGAKKIYAIDTAKGKLALKLREDPRVVIMESTDVRGLEKLPEVPEIVTVDVSLISLRDLLPAVLRIMAKKGKVVALFKPQYETRDPKTLHHGVIENDDARARLLKDFSDWLGINNWSIMGQIESPILGSKGNKEYLFFLIYH